MKIGTRVVVQGVETYIRETHADIERGVYRVRTNNPTYEFKQNPAGDWWAGDSSKPIWLEKASKYGNYQVGDRVKDTRTTQKGVVSTVTASSVEVAFEVVGGCGKGVLHSLYRLSASVEALPPAKSCLKKIRVSK